MTSATFIINNTEESIEVNDFRSDTKAPTGKMKKIVPLSLLNNINSTLLDAGVSPTTKYDLLMQWVEKKSLEVQGLDNLINRIELNIGDKIGEIHYVDAEGVTIKSPPRAFVYTTNNNYYVPSSWDKTKPEELGENKAYLVIPHLGINGSYICNYMQCYFEDNIEFTEDVHVISNADQGKFVSVVTNLTKSMKAIVALDASVKKL